MMWPYNDGGSWIWMSAMMILIWGGGIALVIWAMRAFTGARSTGDPAIATLRRRLAAGEISQDEFEKTRRILQG